MTALQKLQRAAGTTGAHSQWGLVVDASKEKMGGNFPLQQKPKTDRQIKACLLRAAKTVRRKQLAEYADVTDETAKSWIVNGNAPRFVESVRLGQSVPQIRAAIIELMRQGELNPHHDEPVNYLLSALAYIASENPDAKTRKRAKDALRDFNEAKGRA